MPGASAAIRQAKQKTGKAKRHHFDAQAREHYRYNSQHASPLVADEHPRAQWDRWLSPSLPVSLSLCLSPFL